MSRIALALLVVVSLLPGCVDDSSGGGAPATVVKSTYFTQTQDGWTIAVHRWQKSTGVLWREPVLLSGGFLENAQVFDAFPRFSVANDLAWSGYDVWAYDIRGTGQSQSPEVGNLFGWTFSADEFILQDTPAAVAFVLAQTGAPQLHWVAHSLGGTMLLGYLQRRNPSLVKSAVMLGGIGRLSDEESIRSGFLNVFFQIGTILSYIIPPNMPLPLRWALDQILQQNPFAWAGICYALDSFLGQLFWEPDSINPNLIYQFLTKALSNTSTNVLRQVLRWAGDQRVVGEDGWDYTAALPSVTTPMCVMAGGGDLMVTPANCQYVHQNISSAEKEYVECSIATGHSFDYGHVDMLLGTKARLEVYHHILEWIGPRSTPR